MTISACVAEPVTEEAYGSWYSGPYYPWYYPDYYYWSGGIGVRGYYGRWHGGWHGPAHGGGHFGGGHGGHGR